MIERDDEFDWHTPLYDRKDFKTYAMDVVLKAVGVKLASRRRIKLRLGKKALPYLVDHALDYLILYGKIRAEVRGAGITYFMLVNPTRLQSNDLITAGLMETETETGTAEGVVASEIAITEDPVGAEGVSTVAAPLIHAGFDPAPQAEQLA